MNSGLRVQVVNDDQQCAAELKGPLGPSSKADHKHQSHPLKSMNCSQLRSRTVVHSSENGLRVQVVKDDQQCDTELKGPLSPSSKAVHKHHSHQLKSMNLQSVEVEDLKPSGWQRLQFACLTSDHQASKPVKARRRQLITNNEINKVRTSSKS